MSKSFQILNNSQQRMHNQPPAFSSEQRKSNFYLSIELQTILNNKVRGTANKVFFVVSFVYFRETGQFYNEANARDLKAACNRFGVERTLEWEEYKKGARDNHKAIILDHFCIKPFTENAHDLIKGETIKSLRSKRSPVRCFRQVIQVLKDYKYEIPQYLVLSNIISGEYNNHHRELMDVVNEHLTTDVKLKLDLLTEKPKNKDGTESTAYSLTLAKRFSHATRVNKIRKNIEIHSQLLELYQLIEPVLKKLNLNNEGIKSFATSVEYDQVFQIRRKKDDDRYLHLIVFIANQFYRLQDILTQTLIAIMKQSFNSAERDAKNEYYKNRSVIRDHTIQVCDNTENIVEQLNLVKNILLNDELTPEEKVNKSLDIIVTRQKQTSEAQEHINFLNDEANKLSGDEIFIDILSAKANSLQLKCKDIILGLTFDFESSDKKLGQLIKKYRENNGKIDSTYPISSLDKKYREFIKISGKFNVNLYKVLFFSAVAKAIKSEALNLKNSHNYTSLEHDLISIERFKAERELLLSKAGMSEFSSCKQVISSLKLEVDRQFHETNRRIIGNENSFIVSDTEGGFKVVSQRNTLLENQLFKKTKTELYPKENLISLVEALYSVNKATNFLDEFIHIKQKSVKNRPEDKMFFAGIMGLGNHLGAPRIAKLSQNTINENTLVSTIKAYFSLENIRSAIDIIIHKTGLMPVANLLRTDDITITSSDGQKYVVSYESLNANFSFKYGGRDQVLSAYTFIDSRNLFFYSTVISGEEFEAHYMLDGVLYNKVIKSTMHATDSHGYSEAVYGISHLLNVSFAPRIKGFQNQQLYSFSPRSKYKRLGYPVLPKTQINEDRIEEHYENILRLVVSIKLGETTASRVFRRMNSRSKHNPLYDAVKEFGRIPKTLHLLRYMDDEEYRSVIQKQLNKGESGNKLDRALAVGSPEYTDIEKDDQELVDGCKRLLKNTIVCWNYMHLSKLLKGAKSDIEKSALIDKILATSTVTYKHFLIQGEFPFTQNRLIDSMNFKFSDFLNPSLVELKRGKDNMNSDKEDENKDEKDNE